MAKIAPGTVAGVTPSIIPEVLPLGDSAVLVVVGDEVGVDTSAAVRRLDVALDAVGAPGIVDVVPALVSLLVRFDPAVRSPEDVTVLVAEAAAAAPGMELPAPRTWRVPAIYGGSDGPDLEAVADTLGRSADAVIEAHTSTALTVLANGFAPGFCYLGLLGEEWDLPRRRELHASVPAGSISVAVRQTVLSATPMPTGWSTIAWTPLVNLRSDEGTPLVIEAGDRVRFEPVAPVERERLVELHAAGRLPVRETP